RRALLDPILLSTRPNDGVHTTSRKWAQRFSTSRCSASNGLWVRGIPANGERVTVVTNVFFTRSVKKSQRREVSMTRFLKCSLMPLVVIAIATAAFADKLPANRHILIIADTEHGLALVPEGTTIPRSLALRVRPEKTTASFVRQPRSDDDALRAELTAMRPL